MTKIVDPRRFGPWALITGASSGLGAEFARRIAGSGINVVLAARRQSLLETVGAGCARDFDVKYRVVAADLSDDGAVQQLAKATDDLDIGLVVSNAGTGNAGPFLTKRREDLAARLRLNTLAHLDLALHYGAKLVARQRGGLLFVGAMGAQNGMPFMASEASAKAYIRSLSLSLHDELKAERIHVTLLATPPTDTPVLAQLGLSPDAMPMKPMRVDRCVEETLRALAKNQATIIPGRVNRLMSAAVPPSVIRAIMGKMFRAAFAAGPAAPLAPSR
jgi:short-subunit dehydrogenase